MGSPEIDRNLRGQTQIWKYMLNYADSMVVKSAVELDLADIIHSHDGPITLSQIATKLNSSCLNTSYLSRLMRVLVRKGIFTAYRPPKGGEILYGPTETSTFLLRDSELSLAPLLLLLNYQQATNPWHYISKSVKDGSSAFKSSNGCEFWDFAMQNPDFSKMLSDGMACTTKIVMNAFKLENKHGFDNIQSVVDVGGETGATIAEIVKQYPHIAGINFDLPHVVATAPAHDGVLHVGGDMFKAIPAADVAFLKWLLNSYDDESCVKILQNCRKAIPEKNGKVIIVEIVMREDEESLFAETELAFDMLMLVTNGGKERTEEEWKKILEEAGFPRYKIIHMPTLQSIIEAYPL